MTTPHPAIPERDGFQRLQSLDDAITYRTARAAAPCPDCATAPAGTRCDDHACDLTLITRYRTTATAISAALTLARGTTTSARTGRTSPAH